MKGSLVLRAMTHATCVFVEYQTEAIVEHSSEAII